MGCWLHGNGVYCNGVDCGPGSEWTAPSWRRSTGSYHIINSHSTWSGAVRSSRRVYHRELCVSRCAAVLQRHAPGARSSRSPRTSLRNGSSVWLCGLHYWCIADIPFFHRISADPRCSSESSHRVSSECSSIYGTRRTCVHVRPHRPSLSAFLITPHRILPRPQCNPRKETYTLARSLSRRPTNTGRSKEI